jgi:hypothetical protein
MFTIFGTYLAGHMRRLDGSDKQIINNNNNNSSIQLFNYSVIYYLCAESTALKPITDTAQSTCKYMLIQKTNKQTNKQTYKK